MLSSAKTTLLQCVSDVFCFVSLNLMCMQCIFCLFSLVCFTSSFFSLLLLFYLLLIHRMCFLISINPHIYRTEVKTLVDSFVNFAVSFFRITFWYFPTFSWSRFGFAPFPTRVTLYRYSRISSILLRPSLHHQIFLSNSAKRRVY